MAPRVKTVKVKAKKAKPRGKPLAEYAEKRELKSWVTEAGFDHTKYGIESLRRTKALHILNSTGDLETVRVLLGHEKIESTSHYLSIAKRTKSDPIAISRAFDISLLHPHRQAVVRKHPICLLGWHTHNRLIRLAFFFARAVGYCTRGSGTPSRAKACSCRAVGRASIMDCAARRIVTKKYLRP
jgi:hypothetical protein